MAYYQAVADAAERANRKLEESGVLALLRERLLEEARQDPTRRVVGTLIMLKAPIRARFKWSRVKA